MARPRRIDEELVRKATEAVKSPGEVAEFRSAQAILLPAVMGATLEQTATLLGVSRASQYLVCRHDSDRACEQENRRRSGEGAVDH